METITEILNFIFPFLDTQQAIVVLTFLLTIVAFMADKVRSAIVALCSMAILLTTNVITPSEALAGFSNSAVVMMIGLFIVGGPRRRAFARFSRTARIAVVSTGAAFFIGNILMFAFGAIGGLAAGMPDISAVMIAQGLVISGIVILGLNIWTTNDNTIYAASLAFSNITKMPMVNILL